MAEPIRYTKLRISGDGTSENTRVQDETGKSLPVESFRLEVDAYTGLSSLWLKLTMPELELDLDLTPVEKRAYE